MVIGIGGKLCAGKNRATQFFERCGFQVIDVDRVGHTVLQQDQERLVAYLGPGILGEDGAIDRRKLAGMVFENRNALRILESAVHPTMILFVKEEVRLRQTMHPSGHIVINAALLFYMGLHHLCDVALWIEAPLIVRLLRGIRRDGVDQLPSILKRCWAQRQLSPRRIGSLIPQSSDEEVDTYIVHNRSSIHRLEDKLRALKFDMMRR